MRKGFNPEILLDKRGQVFAIATGSDACAEHECGSARLMDSLCGFPQEGQSDSALIAALRRGESPQYPALVDRKRLTRNLDKVTFMEGTDGGQPVAVLGFSPYGEIPLDHHELRSWASDSTIVTGAWCDSAFAIRVVGQKWVTKLKRFADELREGNCLFAGTFLNDTGHRRLAGVIIANEKSLRPEHRDAIAKAQSEWEASLRLKARSRLDELQEEYWQARKTNPKAEYPGFIWPVWKDGVVDGEVLYALNPGYGVRAPYWGPYDFEQLRAWVFAEKKFDLQPVKKAA